MNKKYQRLTIYTTSSCNLDCNYCYEKNYRKSIIINHPQDYNIYIDKMLELEQTDIKTIELWGGESLLGLGEFIDYIPNFIETFPYWKELYFSTNLALNNSDTLIQNLYQTLDKYVNHKFIIKIQISLDGPKDITDYHRGAQVTELILNNLNKINQLNFNSSKISIQFFINSVLSKETLYYIKTYKDIENWFDFFLNNISDNIKIGLPKININDIWTDEDGIQYGQILKWMDIWRKIHPIEAERFNWLDYKPFSLKLCAAVSDYNQIALSPQGDLGLCHRAILEGLYLNEHNVHQVNFTTVIEHLSKEYMKYKDIISREDFLESLYIYVSIIWCPFDGRYDNGYLNNFQSAMPLYYNGAMNILLKWSRQYGQS